MLERRNMLNELMVKVHEQGLLKLGLATVITQENQMELSDFLVLTREILEEEIFFGTFQLKHSLSYLAEHFNQNNGKSVISIIKNDRNIEFKIITSKIHSRHFSQKEFRVYVSYKPISISFSKLIQRDLNLF